MAVLVAYASKYGATREIAERIAKSLQSADQQADARAIKSIASLDGYDVFVIGSAVYFGSWQKEATEFVRRHENLLSTRPVWLFSSGPLRMEASEAERGDAREAATPTQIDGMIQAIRPRDHHVFYGALTPSKLSLRDRLIRALPAGRAMMPEGDFRDWGEVDSWAQNIARTLRSNPSHAPGPASPG